MTTNAKYRKQLEQIYNSKTKDKDLHSPVERDRLVSDGLVECVDGYNIITSDGVRAFALVDSSTIGVLDRDDTIRLLTRIAARRARYASLPTEHSVFTANGFSEVVSDIMSLEHTDHAMICFILSGRDWVTRQNVNQIEKITFSLFERIE